MPSLSIVIASCRGHQRLEEGLVSVLQHQPDDSQVIVVLNEPYHDPYALASEVRFVQAPLGAPLTTCWSVGTAGCHTPYVHYLAAGHQVACDWAVQPLEMLSADTTLAGVIPATFAEPGSAASFGIRCRTGGAWSTNRVARIRGPLGPRLDAAFFRTAALQWLGGVRAGWDRAAAELDLALAIRRSRLPLAIAETSQIRLAASAASMRGAWLRGRGLEAAYWRNLARWQWPEAICWHPWRATVAACGEGSLWRGLSHLAGRGTALLDWSAHRQRRQQLAAACRPVGGLPPWHQPPPAEPACRPPLRRAG